jgi:RNase P/RNase MRP subunit p29
VSPSETQLLFSVPMTVYADRYYSRHLSEQQEADVFKDMYLNADAYKGEVGYYNFFHNLVNEAKAVLDRPMKWPNNVQFTGVSYSSDAESALAGEVELTQLSKLFATWATANLAEATGEPIIPASMGENKLTLVMRDASRQIVLPKPYYEFDMHVQALETYKNSQYTCFDVASYFGVKVSGGEMLLDAPIQHGENSCAFLESGSAKESNIYPANIMSQIQQVMFSFSQKTSDMAYIQSHIVGDTNAVLNSIEKVKKEVFNGG